MISRQVDESEELLKILSQRRKVLEQKTALRMATVNEFKAVKEQSLHRLRNSIVKQNETALERNRKLMRDINFLTSRALSKRVQSGPGSSVIRTSAGDRLSAAKKSYFKKTEDLLPNWKQSKIESYEEEMKKLKAEKRIAEERRLKLQAEIEREEKLKEAIEQERRALALALALEQRVQMEARVQEYLRLQEGEAVDKALLEHFECVSEKLREQVVTRSRTGAKRALDELAPYFQASAATEAPSTAYISADLPIPIPQPPTSASATTALGTVVAPPPLVPVDFNEKEVIAKARSSIAMAVSHTTSPRHDTSHDLAAKTTGTSQQAVAKIESSLAVSTDAHSMFSPYSHSRGSSPVPVGSSHAHVEKLAEKDKQSTHLDAFASAAAESVARRKESEHTQANNAASGASSTAAAIVASSSGGGPGHVQRDGQGQGEVSPKKLTEEELLRQEAEMLIEQMALMSGASNAAGFSSHAGSWHAMKQLTDAGITSADIHPDVHPDGLSRSQPQKEKERSLSLDKPQDEATTAQSGGEAAGRAIATDSPTTEHRADTETQRNEVASTPAPAQAQSRETGTQPRRASPLSTLFGSTSASAHDQVAAREGTGQGGREVDGEVDGDGDAASTVASSTRSDSHSDAEGDSTLFASLSLRDCSRAVSQLASRVIEALKESRSQGTAGHTYGGKIYAEAYSILTKPGWGALSGIDGMKSVSRVAKAVSRMAAISVSGSNSMNTGFPAGADQDVLRNADIYVAAAALLRVVQEGATDIMPSEALNGVVTLDRLRKEHKKVVGRYELWSAVVAHLKELLEINGANLNRNLDELSICFTDCLIGGADHSEKSRIERKVSKLVQLAILPPDSESGSIPSTPSPRASSSSSGGGVGGLSALKNWSSNMMGVNMSASSSAFPKRSYSNVGALMEPSGAGSPLGSDKSGKESPSASGRTPYGRAATAAAAAAAVATPLPLPLSSRSTTSRLLTGGLKAIELDDEELESVESLGAPPPLPDLAAPTYKQGGSPGGGVSGSGRVGSKAGSGRITGDDFDF